MLDFEKGLKLSRESDLIEGEVIFVDLVIKGGGGCDVSWSEVG